MRQSALGLVRVARRLVTQRLGRRSSINSFRRDAAASFNDDIFANAASLLASDVSRSEAASAAALAEGLLESVI